MALLTANEKTNYFHCNPALLHKYVCAKSKKNSISFLQKNTASAKPFVKKITPGAYWFSEYVPKLKGRRVAVFANNTSMVGNTHLVDTLKKLGVNIVKIFAPEHGFRGTANAGEKVNDYTDEATHIPVISLYGKKEKPSESDMQSVDALVFDIQDVGVRFYTYISSLQKFIETAMYYNKPLYILDRPNPNGFYVDGPVLDTAFSSFVGMQPVPVVYGMTVGEYANFLIGEGLVDRSIFATWMMRLVSDTAVINKEGGNRLNITVVKCGNYTHKSRYVLPVKPSPNLPDSGAVYWYPSICFFEGTVFSEGRGTGKPFQVFGHPALPQTLYAFTPKANAGAANPKFKDTKCYGWNVSENVGEALSGRIQLKYLLDAYKLFSDKDNFFTKPKIEDAKPQDYFFNKLAGNATLMQQIVSGKSEKEIRDSWQPKLDAFKKKRKKYLMYPDFE